MMWPAKSTTAEARAVGIGETKEAAVEQTLAGKSRELAANKKAAVWKVNLTGYVQSVSLQRVGEGIGTNFGSITN